VTDRLDPQVRALLARFDGKPLMHRLPVAIARRGFDRTMIEMVPRGPDADVTQREIDGPAGPLRVRVYRPLEPSCGPRPLAVFMHGGGWVVGSLDSHDPLCRALCVRGGAVVVSVDYRLAPEHRFPAAPDDCEAAARWAIASARTLGADPDRVVVAGDSAGGNLAAVTALRLRDAGESSLAGQVLLYPVTDHCSAGSASYEAFGSGFGLERDTMHWFWEHYLGASVAAASVPPHAAPLRVVDLSGLPPALVVTAGHDVLRDEGEAYARRLDEAGVSTVLERHDGLHHGFASWYGLLDAADRSVERVATWIASRRAPSA
jgi:acetyl esterase